MNYVFLAIAIIAELISSSTIKATESFTRLKPSLVVITAAAVSLYFFARCVESLNLAIVYALWSGIGICVVTLMGWLVYKQKLDLPAMAGIGLIVAGVVIINLYSNTIAIPE